MELSQSKVMESDNSYEATLGELELAANENENTNIALHQASEVQEGDALLIELVANYPILYNKSLRDYKNTVMCENCWIQIGFVMNMQPVDCMKRWGQLRENFSREKKKRDEESKSGSEPSRRRGFVFYQDMKFLENHIQRRKTHDISNSLLQTNRLAARIENPMRQISNRPFQPFTNASSTSGISLARTPFRSIPLVANVRAFLSSQSSFENSVPRQFFNIPPSETTPSVSSVLTPVANVNKQMILSSTSTAMMPPSTPTPLYSPPVSPAICISKPPSQTPSPMSCSSSPVEIYPETLRLSPCASTSSYTPTSASFQCSPISEHPLLARRSSISPSSDITKSPSLSFIETNLDYGNTSCTTIPTSTNRSPGTKRLQSNSSWINDNTTEVNSSPPCKLVKPTACYNKESSRPKKVDQIDSSFMNLSVAIQEHLSKSAQTKIAETCVNSTDSDELFSSLISAELRKLDEPFKSAKKARLLQILYEKD